MLAFCNHWVRVQAGICAHLRKQFGFLLSLTSSVVRSWRETTFFFCLKLALWVHLGLELVHLLITYHTLEVLNDFFVDWILFWLATRGVYFSWADRELTVDILRIVLAHSWGRLELGCFWRLTGRCLARCIILLAVFLFLDCDNATAFTDKFTAWNSLT